MRTVHLAAEDDFDGWRDAARALVQATVSPDDVLWTAGGTTDLFADEAAPDLPPASAAGGLRVPRAFVDLAGSVALHADPDRWHLLYTMLWRLGREPGLMADKITINSSKGLIP